MTLMDCFACRIIVYPLLHKLENFFQKTLPRDPYVADGNVRDPVFSTADCVKALRYAQVRSKLLDDKTVKSGGHCNQLPPKAADELE